MINLVGKTLVFVNLALSLFFLSWALAIYTQRLDWGWKDPRKDLGERVPSEYDKRTLMLEEFQQSKARADGDVAAARTELAVPQLALPENHFWYNAELARLELAEGEIKVKAIQRNKGRLVLDPKALGRPVLGEIVPGVVHAAKGYRDELEALRQKVRKGAEKVQELVKQEKALTDQLSKGLDEQKKLRPGLNDLLDEEFRTQEQLKREADFLRPMWVRELVNAQLLVERRQRLETRLAELKAALERRPVAAR
jgi:hypothetical protein